MWTKDEIDRRVGAAVTHYWRARAGQRQRQETAGKQDQGLRSAVTGGAQMDGFIDLFTEAISVGGIPDRFIFRKKAVELPGYFRPTKEWDLLVVKDNTLIAALEAKSQVGPSLRIRTNWDTSRIMRSSWPSWRRCGGMPFACSCPVGD